MGTVRGCGPGIELIIEVDVLSGENNKMGLFISCSMQLVISGHQAELNNNSGCAWSQESKVLNHSYAESLQITN